MLAAVVDVAGALVVEDRRGRVRRAARQFDAHVHVGEQVLDRLERTDRHAELVALERVRRRDVERALRHADELRGGEDGAGAAQPLRVLGSAERVAARQVGIGERRASADRTVRRPSARGAPTVANDSTPSSCDDEDDVALGGVLDDERRAGDDVRSMPVTRIAPVRDVGQQRRGDRRPQQRAGREVRAELLEDDGGFDRAGARPAVLGRQQHPEDAHVGQRAPGGGVCWLSPSRSPTFARAKCC